MVNRRLRLRIRPRNNPTSPALDHPFPSCFRLSLAGLSLLLLTGTAHAGVLSASDGVAGDRFGHSVSLSGNMALVGATPIQSISSQSLRSQGSAYVFRSLDTATGTTTQNATLSITNFDDQGGARPNFGFSVSLSGNQGIVGAMGMDRISSGFPTLADVGGFLVFPGLDTATGTNSVNMNGGSGVQGDVGGWSVSNSGRIGLVGSPGRNGRTGVVNVSRDGEGQVAQLNGLRAGAGAIFGYSVSVSGNIGLVAAPYQVVNSVTAGAVYVFRNLDTIRSFHTGTVMLTTPRHPRLILGGGGFGNSVSVSGSIGLVGSSQERGGTSNSIVDQGAAYVFRGLDTATASITAENVRLTASDAAAGARFGGAVSLSGSTGLVGAFAGDSAYLFRNLDTATGNITENVKLTASDAAGGSFGHSVSLDGDQFLIGAPDKNSSRGLAYSGSVSSFTTLDTGSTSKTIEGLSFVSQDDWITGQTTDSNQVTLSAGDTGNVTASGKAVYIGKDAGSDNNTLVVNGTLTASQITIGAAGNTGNTLRIGTGGTLAAASITTHTGNALVINGAVTSTSMVVTGSLSGSGNMANATLSGSGSINPGNSPGVMTAAATDPTGGLDYNFEFTVSDALPAWNAPTASGNDVLRLTTIPTPFTASLSAANEVNIYLNAGALTAGEVFTGGFYTDSNADFLSSISSGTFTYLVATPGGAIPTTAPTTQSTAARSASLSPPSPSRRISEPDW
jgi:hypothetical protein